MARAALTSGRRAAARLRAEWLAAVAEGRVSVTDVVVFAARLEGRGLRSLRVETLLGAQPGWSVQRARAAHERLRMLCGVNSSAVVPDRMTVGHLLDGRSDRSRWWALVVADPVTPFEGFPFRSAGG